MAPISHSNQAAHGGRFQASNSWGVVIAPHRFTSRPLVARALSVLALIPALVFGPTSPLHAAGGVGSSIEVPSESSAFISVPGLSPSRTYRFIATGSYSHTSIPYGDPGSTEDDLLLSADAECVEVPSSTVLVPDSIGAVPPVDNLDLYIDGNSVVWDPLSNLVPPSIDQNQVFINPAGTAWVSSTAASGIAYTYNNLGCDPNHEYAYDYTTPPAAIGQASVTVTLEIKDLLGHSDNNGSLFVFIACEENFPSEQLFIQQAAINARASETVSSDSTDSGACPSGRVFTPSSLRQRQNADFPLSDSYTCSKPVRKGPTDRGETFGYLSTAELRFDTRDNVYDPIHPDTFPESAYYPSRSYSPSSTYYDPDDPRYYKQSGHWGLRTCNWAKKDQAYRIVVRGVYKYDQSAPPGAGLADAECATGWPESSYSPYNLDGTLGAVKQDALIPGVYNYLLQDAEYNAANLGVGSIQYRPYASTGSFDKFGVDPSGDALTTTATMTSSSNPWQSDRFKFWPTPAMAHPDTEIDALDLHFGIQGHTKFVDWKPLELSGSALVTSSVTTTVCSSIHTYYTDVSQTVGSSPIHFGLWDLVRYNEWDNCGVLEISITSLTDPASTSFVNPDPQTMGSTGCHYISDYNFRIFMDEAPDRPEQYPTNERIQERSFYFAPEFMAVNEDNFNIQSSTGASTDSRIFWTLRNGAHTITSALDKDGNFCENVKTATSTENPSRQVGVDDCDAVGPSAAARPFDFDSSKIAQGVGTVSWKLFTDGETGAELPTRGTFEANACTGGYCYIPFFCRLAKPEKMRGTIVVKQP